MKRLSKSRIQYGRQCRKRLWLSCNAPKEAQWSNSAQARLDEGTRFGELAQDLLGGGHVVTADHLHLQEALAETAQQLSLPATQTPRIFEPAFEHQNVSVRVDAVSRDDSGDHLIEVKSSTSVKGEYLWDCAIQTWVVRGSGRDVSRVSVAHVNRDFVLQTAGSYDGLLMLVDITPGVEELQPDIEPLVRKLQEVADGRQPAISTGPHCSTPYDCPFLSFCQSQEPAGPAYPLDILPYGGRVVEQLHAQGIMDVRDIPEDAVTNEKHVRIIRSTRENRPYVSDDLAAVLVGIAYPRFFLDFETIQFVIPRWIGTRPFQQIPFQFSCHIDTGSEPLQHAEFLDLSGNDPSRRFAEALVESLGEEGSILVWNRGFEAGRVRELAERFPDLSEALHDIVERMIDLLPIYRDHYYHPDMRGSWSIKAVLPTIAPDLDYEQLGVSDGGAAQDAYRQAIASDTSDADRSRLDRELREYCGLDTLAMVRLIEGPRA